MTMLLRILLLAVLFVASPAAAQGFAGGGDSTGSATSSGFDYTSNVRLKWLYSNGTNFQALYLAGGSLGTLTEDNSSDTSTSHVNAATAATLNAEAGWSPGNDTRPSLRPDVTVFMRTGASIAALRCRVGLNVNGGGLADDTGIASSAYFRYSTATTDVNWQACSANGGSLSCENTGVAVLATTAYKLRVDCRTTAGTCDYYVNDVLKVSKTTTVPTSSTDYVGIGASCRTLEAVSKSIKISQAILIANP